MSLPIPLGQSLVNPVHTTTSTVSATSAVSKNSFTAHPANQFTPQHTAQSGAPVMASLSFLVLLVMAVGVVATVL